MENWENQKFEKCARKKLFFQNSHLSAKLTYSQPDSQKNWVPKILVHLGGILYSRPRFMKKRRKTRIDSQINLKNETVLKKNAKSQMLKK